MLRHKRFWLGLIVSVAFLAYFLSRTDFHEIRSAFAAADYWIAIGVAPLYFVGFWLRTIRWRYLLRPVSDVSTPRLYPVVLIGLMANNVAPARVGELVRAYLLGERESMSKSTALGTIAVDRAFDGLTLVAILGISMLVAGSSATVKGLGVSTAATFLLVSAVLAGLALSPRRFHSRLLSLLKFLPEPLVARIEALLDSFLVGLAAIRRPWRLLGAAFFSAASWLVEGAMYYVIGRAFHLDVGLDVYLIILAGANLALSILATPGGIGPFEATTKQILVSFGVSSGQAVAYAIALHALLLGPVILVGFVLLWLSQFSFGQIMAGESRTPAVAGRQVQSAE